MKKLNLFIILILVAIIAVPALFGQSREMTVEEAYLQEAMYMMVIRDTSRAGTREDKMIALEYIGSALERGLTNPEIHTALDFMVLEGSLNQTRERGRLMNNFPEVRREAAR